MGKYEEVQREDGAFGKWASFIPFRARLVWHAIFGEFHQSAAMYTWLLFAICLRPIATPRRLRKYYPSRKAQLSTYTERSSARLDEIDLKVAAQVTGWPGPDILLGFQLLLHEIAIRLYKTSQDSRGPRINLSTRSHGLALDCTGTGRDWLSPPALLTGYGYLRFYLDH